MGPLWSMVDTTETVLLHGLQMISIQSMKAQNDVYLRFDELPCTEYDNKVTHNKVCLYKIIPRFDLSV